MFDAVVWTVIQLVKSEMRSQINARQRSPNELALNDTRRRRWSANFQPRCSSGACEVCHAPRAARDQVELTLRAKPPETRRTLLRVLQWVAFAMRPLHAGELLLAVSTDTGIGRCSRAGNQESESSSLLRQDDLFVLCSGLLERTEQDVVQFVHESVKHFVLSPAMRALDAHRDNQIHEMMAAVCLRHIVCLDESGVLKPWISAGRTLRGELTECHLMDYSHYYWLQHFRIAEPGSIYLPSLLCQALQRALKAELKQLGLEPDGYLASEWTIDQGLHFCACNDLAMTAQMYLEMNAKYLPRESAAATLAVASDSVNVLTLITDRMRNAGDLSSLFSRVKGITLIETASCYNSPKSAEHLLNLRQGTGLSIWNPSWILAFRIAMVLRHDQVLEVFSRLQPEFAASFSKERSLFRLGSPGYLVRLSHFLTSPPVTPQDEAHGQNACIQSRETDDTDMQDSGIALNPSETIGGDDFGRAAYSGQAPTSHSDPRRTPDFEGWAIISFADIRLDTG